MDENRPEVINDVRPGRNNYFKLQIIQFAGKGNRYFCMLRILHARGTMRNIPGCVAPEVGLVQSDVA